MDLRREIATHIPHLRRFARALTGDAALADDLVQDCIERAINKQHLFDETRNLRTWLFTILRNLFVSSVRRSAREAVAVGASEGDGSVHPDQDSRLAIKDVAQALERLSPDQREVVLLIALEDMSYREVAEVIGVPIGTIMSRLSRARSRLRAMLQDEEARPQLRTVK